MPPRRTAKAAGQTTDTSDVLDENASICVGSLKRSETETEVQRDDKEDKGKRSRKDNRGKEERSLEGREDFVLFHGSYMSQWHMSTFTYGELEFNCAEQWMMYHKARIFNDEETMRQVLTAKTPMKQKALGRGVKNFDAEVWDKVCDDVVFQGNVLKFTQDKSLEKLLLATGDRVIVEASPKDRVWGIGLSAKDPRAKDMTQWLGTNRLGQALMRTRETIRSGSKAIALALTIEV